MSNDETTQVEPSEASLAEMPEVDFSRAIRPNKLAALRGDFKQAVFLDMELWQHFGSEERVLEALRLLVSLAETTSRSVPSERCRGRWNPSPKSGSRAR